jgi:hypothetical protein
MNGEASESRRLLVREGFSWEPIPDGCLLFEERTGKLLTLNPAAEAVLAHCDGELTAAEITARLTSEFEIPATETRRLLEQLRAEGVIAPVA